MCLIKEMKKDQLHIEVYESRQSMGEKVSREVAQIIIELLKYQKEVNMIFAAAPSQNEFLLSFIQEDIEWDRINAFHMDEYVGLDEKAPQKFGNFLKKCIFDKVPFKSVQYINGNALDIQKECDRYAELLERYPADIVCMGIGENGHIAFNDPHVAYFHDSETVKMVDLDEECRKQQVNDGCFATLEQVPSHALTLTIPILTKPKYVFCIVPGATKAKAVYDTIKGNINESCPASILRTHKQAILYLDRDSSEYIL